jgi:hypothetical protein
MGIPDSPWQGRATSSERGSVEILDEWSANRKVSRNASAVSDAPHSKKAARFGDVVRGASDTAV